MTLLFDMPLDALKTYQGTNPRPADHDQYWQAALAEMHATDSNVELLQSEFQVPFADCYDLYFTGVRGSRVYAKYLKPNSTAGPHPGIVEFHGYSGHSGDWTTKLPWVAMGYSVMSLDCRGQGGKSQDSGGVHGTTLRGHIIRGLDDPKPDNLLFRHIFLDTAQLAGILMDMPEVDADRVGATGSSQGGGLTLACAALAPRIKRAAPTIPFLCDYKRVWEIEQAKAAYEELSTYFRQYDPLHQREDQIFERLGYIDVQHLTKRIKANVLMAVALSDTVCPPSTKFAAFNKITSKKDFVLYPDFGHEALPSWGDKVFQFMRDL